MNDSKFFIAAVQNEEKFSKLFDFSERTYGKQKLAPSQGSFVFICFLGNSRVPSQTKDILNSHLYNSPVKNDKSTRNNSFQMLKRLINYVQIRLVQIRYTLG